MNVQTKLVNENAALQQTAVRATEAGRLATENAILKQRIDSLRADTTPSCDTDELIRCYEELKGIQLFDRCR